MDRKKIYKFLLPAEILILLALGILLAIRWRTNRNIGLSVADWKSDYVAYDSINGWYVDEKLIDTQENISVIYGPSVYLKEGTYCAKITYHCDYDQSCTAYAGEGNEFQLKTGGARLGRNFDSVSYDFEAREDIENFELLFYYNGKGYLQITNISIAPTSTGLFRNICIVFAFFACLDLCLLFADRIEKHKNTVLALIGIVLLTSLPIFTDGIASGHDIGFHLTRIEGISKEIRLGNIPVRLVSSYMDGYGYPVSIYYGDLLLYIPAVLRLLGFSVTGVYKFYVLMINAGTAVLTYLCMKRVFKDNRIALLTCLSYCTSSYRMVNIYERAAVGEYSAMMFMPMVAAAVYKIYTDDISDYKEYRNNAVFLAVGMSGLIGTHILSTEMAVFILAVICLSLLKLTFRKNTVKVYLQAVMWTCLFSAYFIVPFLDYTLNVPTKVGAVINGGGADIQDCGITIGEYFAFFRDIQNGRLEYANERMLLTPGIVLMASLIIAIVLWINRRGNKEMKALTVYACLSVALTLNIFPWNYLQEHFLLGNLLSQVQFPWRYISVAMVVLTLLLGNLLVQISKERIKMERSEKAVVAVCFVMTCFLTGNYMDNSSFVNIYEGVEMNHYSVGFGEYLREGTNRLNFSTSITSEIYSENMEEVSVVSRKGNSMELRCVASDEEGFMWLPMFNYKGYHATDESGNEYPISDGYDNRIKLSLPVGFEGKIWIEYREPWYWRGAELISFLAVLGVCIWKMRDYLNNCSNRKLECIRF